MAKNDWLYIVAGFGAVIILYLYLNKSSSTTTSTQSAGVINTPSGSLIKTNDGFNLGDWIKRFPIDINTYTFGEKSPPSTPSGIISGIATPIDQGPISPDTAYSYWAQLSQKRDIGSFIQPLSSTSALAPALGFASTPSPSTFVLPSGLKPATSTSQPSTQLYVAPPPHPSTQLYVAPSTPPSTPSTQPYTPSTSTITHTSTGFKVSAI